MNNYAQYFSNKSDDNALKKYFYLLVEKGLSEDIAWYTLSTVITGGSIEHFNNDIKELLNEFKVEYDAQSKLAEEKRKEEAVKFKNSLKPETLSKVKDIWKELNS